MVPTTTPDLLDQQEGCKRK